LLNAIALWVFLTLGLYSLSILRESYLDQPLVTDHEVGIFHIVIRYISLGCAILLLWISSRYIRNPFMGLKADVLFDVMFHISVLWIASSELIHWLDLGDSTQAYKLGLSILWGVYSLLLISYGIWRKKKYLRVGAIVLFGVTLLKLFFYDLSEMGTIAKTIVFVSLGVLLLIISFLYNKYAQKISDEKS